MVVLIVIAILLVGTTSFISALGYTSYVRNAIGIVLTPLQKSANSVFEGVEDFFASKKDYKKLKAENERLKVELAEKESMEAEAQLALEENERLKEYLGIKDEHTDFQLTDAFVTGRQANTHTFIYTIDKGSRHGIEPGMPVIDKFGLMGSVCEVGLTWSKVTSVTEPDVSIGVYIERTGEEGISTGTFAAAREGLFTVSYLSEGSDIAVGDRILTSGDSTIYPKGLLVGTVERVETDAVLREKIAYIKPAANLTEVSEVMIITEFEYSYE